MRRRSFISTMSGCLLFGLGGCVSGPSKESRTLGESVEHRGVSVTVDTYTTADTVAYDISDSGATPSETAPEGATYLLTHLSVEHTVENKRVFPSRGTFSGSFSDRIKHFYNGEGLTRGRHEDSSTAFIVEGNRLPNYIQVLLQNDMVSAVYSGSASGWLINIIPKDFTPANVTVKITWGASSTMSEKGRKTFSWSYADSPQFSPGETTTPISI